MYKPGGVIFLECPCGLNRGVPVEEFDYDGSITQCPDKHVVVECPDCGDTRKTDEFSRIYKPDQQNDDCPWYRLVLDQKQNPTGGKNPFEPLIDRDGSSSKPAEHPDCDSCGRNLTEGHKRYGPDGPDGAWAYYECPDCQNHIPE